MRQGRLYQAIREYNAVAGCPVELGCKLFHVARSAYHKWVSGKLSCRAVENVTLAEKIEQIHAESPDKGYRRINDELRHDQGIYVNDKKVLRICRARDIKSTIKYASNGPGGRRSRSMWQKTSWTVSFMRPSPIRSG